MVVGGDTAIINRVMWQGLWSTVTGGPKLGLLLHKANKGLADLSALLEQGRIKTIIDRCYPLDQLAEAMHYYSEGRTHGKLVITMVEERCT